MYCIVSRHPSEESISRCLESYLPISGQLKTGYTENNHCSAMSMILMDYSLRSSGGHYMTPTQTKYVLENVSQNYHTFCIKFDVSPKWAPFKTFVVSIAIGSAYGIYLPTLIPKKSPIHGSANIPNLSHISSYIHHGIGIVSPPNRFP